VAQKLSLTADPAAGPEPAHHSRRDQHCQGDTVLASGARVRASARQSRRGPRRPVRSRARVLVRADERATRRRRAARSTSRSGSVRAGGGPHRGSSRRGRPDGTRRSSRPHGGRWLTRRGTRPTSPPRRAASERLHGVSPSLDRVFLFSLRLHPQPVPHSVVSLNPTVAVRPLIGYNPGTASRNLWGGQALAVPHLPGEQPPPHP